MVNNGYHAEALVSMPVRGLTASALAGLKRGVGTPALDLALMDRIQNLAARATRIGKHSYDPPEVQKMVALPAIIVREGEIGADLLFFVSDGKVAKVRRPFGDGYRTGVPQVPVRRSTFTVYVGENPTLNANSGGVCAMLVNHEPGNPMTIDSSLIIIPPIMADAASNGAYHFAGHKPFVSAAHGRDVAVRVMCNRLNIAVACRDGGLSVQFDDRVRMADRGALPYRRIGELDLKDVLRASKTVSY